MVANAQITPNSPTGMINSPANKPIKPLIFSSDFTNIMVMAERVVVNSVSRNGGRKTNTAIPNPLSVLGGLGWTIAL